MYNLIVNVKAHAKRKTAVLSDDKQGNLLVSVGTERKEGKANEAVIDLLADYLGIAKSRIKIVKGHTTPVKKITVT